MNRLLFFLTFITPIVLFSLLGMKKGDVNKTFGGLALGGYDPVAYQVMSRAAKGDAGVSAEYAGATYHFTSHAHLNLFQHNPKAYIPAFGGYCAYSLATEKKRRDIDPTVWDVIAGRLYVFENQKKKTEFGYDAKKFIQQANENW